MVEIKFFFLLFLLFDGRIRIRTNNDRIRIRELKNIPVQHWCAGSDVDVFVYRYQPDVVGKCVND